MKKIFATGLMLLLMVSTAHAVRLGCTISADDDNVTQCTFAHSLATPNTGIMNKTGATKALLSKTKCDTGSIVFKTIIGTGIMNVAMQTAPEFDPTQSGAKPTAFYNTIGSTSTPYHEVDPADSDTWKFDFNSRSFDWWRLNCLAGCDLTNSIAIVFGDCRREGK